jgi:uncharacterized membrane protein
LSQSRESYRKLAGCSLLTSCIWIDLKSDSLIYLMLQYYQSLWCFVKNDSIRPIVQKSTFYRVNIFSVKIMGWLKSMLSILFIFVNKYFFNTLKCVLSYVKASTFSFFFYVNNREMKNHRLLFVYSLFVLLINVSIGEISNSWQRFPLEADKKNDLFSFSPPCCSLSFKNIS